MLVFCNCGSGFACVFVILDVFGVPGPIRDEVGIQTPKNTENVISGNPVWRVFWRQFATFSEVVFVCVFRRCLFRLQGDLWAPKATERVPKWSPK